MELFYIEFSEQRRELRKEWNYTKTTWIDFLNAAELKAQKVIDAIGQEVYKYSHSKLKDTFNDLYKNQMRNSKKIQLQFIKEANDFFKSLGFVPVDASEPYRMKIKTKIGFFYISVDDENNYMFSVYGNFMENPKAAKNYFDHWKQNFHTTDQLSEALEQIKNFYTNILNQVKLCA